MARKVGAYPITDIRRPFTWFRYGEKYLDENGDERLTVYEGTRFCIGGKVAVIKENVELLIGVDVEYVGPVKVSLSPVDKNVLFHLKKSWYREVNDPSIAACAIKNNAYYQSVIPEFPSCEELEANERMVQKAYKMIESI